MWIITRRVAHSQHAFVMILCIFSRLSQSRTPGTQCLLCYSVKIKIKNHFFLLRHEEILLKYKLIVYYGLWREAKSSMPAKLV